VTNVYANWHPTTLLLGYESKGLRSVPLKREIKSDHGLAYKTQTYNVFEPAIAMPRKHNFHLHLPDWSVHKLPSSGTEEKLPLEVEVDEKHPIEEPIPLKSGDIEKVVSDSPSLEKVTSPEGVFSFLYPTRAHLHIHSLKFDWYSRDHRKGRHPVEHGKRRPITVLLRLEYWNISWWVAFVCSL